MSFYNWVINVFNLDIHHFPVPRPKELSIPRPPAKRFDSDIETESEKSYIGHTDEKKKQPHFPNQERKLTKSNAEILTSRLMELLYIHCISNNL